MDEVPEGRMRVRAVDQLDVPVGPGAVIREDVELRVAASLHQADVSSPWPRCRDAQPNPASATMTAVTVPIVTVRATRDTSMTPPRLLVPPLTHGRSGSGRCRRPETQMTRLGVNPRWKPEGGRPPSDQPSVRRTAPSPRPRSGRAWRTSPATQRNRPTRTRATAGRVSTATPAPSRPRAAGALPTLRDRRADASRPVRPGAGRRAPMPRTATGTSSPRDSNVTR